MFPRRAKRFPWALAILLLELAIQSIAITHFKARPPTRLARRLPKSQQNAQPNVLPPNSLPTLKGRVALEPAFLNADWILDHHDFTCLLPVFSATAEMLDFYENIAAFAASTSMATADCYRMVLGEVTLEAKGPVGVPIPWLVVQAFANYMLDMTKRGYTNTYQINLVNRRTGQLLTFSLWVGYIRAVAASSK